MNTSDRFEGGVLSATIFQFLRVRTDFRTDVLGGYRYAGWNGQTNAFVQALGKNFVDWRSEKVTGEGSSRT